MLKLQEELILSPYLSLYDILVPNDHELRKLKELDDFQFIYDELKDKYDCKQGRTAISPIQMFKWLLLKQMYRLSDRDLVKRAFSDMAFKFFLDLAPEADVIDSSTLTKFRRLRLQDKNFLDLLVGKSVEIAVRKNVLKSRTIIVDATHTKARFNQKSPVEILRESSKQLRKEIYQVKPEMKEKFPIKTVGSSLDEEKEYTQKLLDIVDTEPTFSIGKINERRNLLEEKLSDVNFASAESFDDDAKIGHKTADTSFLGYKSHIAMTEDRIITAVTITSGEKADGNYLQELVEKSIENGVEVDGAIADKAYASKDNLAYFDEHQLPLYSRLMPNILNGNPANHKLPFEYNKDSGMMICPAGHQAIRKGRTGKKGQKKNQVTTYYFDIEKCKVCPLKEGCYKVGAKSKTYSISILSETHQAQKDFQETDEFKDKMMHRYKIEAKNAELKNRHGYDIAQSKGFFGMDIQGATTVFLVNLKRILTLKVEKENQS
jgi:transposase